MSKEVMEGEGLKRFIPAGVTSILSFSAMYLKYEDLSEAFIVLTVVLAFWAACG